MANSWWSGLWMTTPERLLGVFVLGRIGGPTISSYKINLNKIVLTFELWPEILNMPHRRPFSLANTSDECSRWNWLVQRENSVVTSQCDWQPHRDTVVRHRHVSARPSHFAISGSQYVSDLILLWQWKISSTLGLSAKGSISGRDALIFLKCLFFWLKCFDCDNRNKCLCSMLKEKRKSSVDIFLLTHICSSLCSV